MLKTNFTLLILLMLLFAGMDNLFFSSPLNAASSAYYPSHIQESRLQESTTHFELNLTALLSSKQITFATFKKVKSIFDQAVAKKDQAESYFFAQIDKLTLSKATCSLIKKSWENSVAAIYKNDPPRHDAPHWKKEYSKQKENEIEQRKLRALIYEQTKTACLVGYHYNKEETVSPDYLKQLQDKMQKDTFAVEHISPITSSGPYPSTEVAVYKTGSIELGIQLKNEGYHPVILNFANKSHVGGGVVRGALAQEEDLFRRSSYFLGLNIKYNPLLNKQLEGTYLIPEFGAIYTPHVSVIRGPEYEGFPFIAPVTLDFIASAAYNKNSHKGDAPADEREYREGMRKKIRTILRLGIMRKHDAIVLGAFGCGAFKNDPKIVSKLFWEVIQEPEFACQYRLIAFAVPSKWAKTHQIFSDRLHELTLDRP